jgi:hypothetical protein
LHTNKIRVTEYRNEKGTNIVRLSFDFYNFIGHFQSHICFDSLFYRLIRNIHRAFIESP